MKTLMMLACCCALSMATFGCAGSGECCSGDKAAVASKCGDCKGCADGKCASCCKDKEACKACCEKKK